MKTRRNKKRTRTNKNKNKKKDKVGTKGRNKRTARAKECENLPGSTAIDADDAILSR